ncbi:hypothetical protein DPM19_12850 [Actinomadura craniellae]|uniref:Uncharacterized protein n=1 Tax=Actinomadura craniellae TaxID=2231787 RepID=A0A365H698_9ACTN|nr:penicillin-binding protein 2 [Actinomadura craniellae]RAY14644.1 hypothetical protein DPM19_12850 [Actinomadura craniellae]
MNMDKPLRRVTIFALLLIMALMINVNYIQGSQAESLQTDRLNNRQFLDVFNRPRGKIIAGNLTLAESEESGLSNPKYARNYTKGLIYSPVTGFFAATGGQSKLELAYNSLLDGRDRRITHQRWFDAFIGRAPKGADIYTTIKPKAQERAYEVLKGSTSQRAGAAVIDIRTGAIVVLAGFPSFDPQKVAPQTGTKGGQLLNQLDADKRLKPLLDKAMNDTFFPGSSFKTVVAALAMEQKGLNKNSSVFTGQLLLPESNRPLPNSHDGGACAGQAPLIQAFAESCNTTFAQMALDMGVDELAREAGKFGFGKPIEVEPDLLGQQSDVPVEVTDPQTGEKRKVGRDDTARSGIGQGSVQATPLQMAMTAAAVANKGKIMKPYLVQKVQDGEDQTVFYEARPREFAQPIKEDTADQLKDMMAAVVTSGTATNLRPFNIAGKTGTAETGIGNTNHRWFVGYAPMNNPRYAFAVVTVGPGSAGGTAGPLAGQIMRAVLAE